MSSYGDVAIKGHDWVDGRWQRIEIIEAAPRTLISEQFLDEVRQGRAHPGITLDSDVLTIRASNRTVIYRIVGRHSDRLNHPDIWVAEWPD